MTRMRLLVFTLCLVGGCSRTTPSQPGAPEFDKLTDEFTRGVLALSPVSATQAGYHEHNGTKLDEQLDDFSAAGIDAQRRFYQDIQGRLTSLNAAPLDREQQADRQILRNNIGGSLLELDTIQNYRHNPTVYVELVGNALFAPYVLNYAPADLRFQHIIKRLEKIPALVDQAKANLVDAPMVWNRVAREENLGNIDLIDHTLRKAAPDADRAAYDAAAAPALAALKDLNTFLADTLSTRTSEWRLGKEKYAQKFAYVLATDKTPEQLLAEAEKDLEATRTEMATLAAPRTVKDALDRIAKQHATPATYMDEARTTLEQATVFIREEGLVTLPPRSNLQVIETPEFMRGIYGVGGFNSAPPLQPELGAFYWITPIPPTWPKARIESKLREYNFFGIQQLTIHEAMPGHYVQQEWANEVQPTSRRVLRSVFANVPYVEGWGMYAQQLMSEEGYLNHNRELRLTWLKQKMRGLANAILDVRLHTMGMTDQQALDLMINDTFQEREEATAKLQRAQLSSCQLPTYYAGLMGWLQARERDKQAKGRAFSLRDFHDRALRESGVPLPELEKLLR
ncbi:MAG TPA: DUF885 domain-containing protein [Vicinamibacterales bacterium]